MVKGARVIILDNGKLLLIHRFKKGKEYWVLPGGAIEGRETPEQTAIREIKEETNLDIELKELLWEIQEEYNSNYGYYFLAKSFKGEQRFGGPETEKQSEDNKYSLEWVSLEKLKEILFYPKEIKEKILKKW